VFFQFTHGTGQDIDIPDAAYSFGTLHAAQAAGDIRALADHRRRTVRLHTDTGDIGPVLDAMDKALEIVAERRH
jgi:hypothetical protein